MRQLIKGVYFENVVFQENILCKTAWYKGIRCLRLILYI